MRFETDILTIDPRNGYDFRCKPFVVFGRDNAACVSGLKEYYSLDNAKKIVIVASTTKIEDAYFIWAEETRRALRIAIERKIKDAMYVGKLWWWVEIVEEF